MSKYTKNDVLEQRISFIPMTTKQVEKLFKHFDSDVYEISDYSHYANKYIRLYPSDSFFHQKSGSSTHSYLNADKSVRSTKEISFEEFDFEEIPQYVKKVGNRIEIAGIKYSVHHSYGYYLYNPSSYNGELFKQFNINSPITFIENVIGYKPMHGGFPEVNTIDDINKVIHALINHKNKSMDETNKKTIGYRLKPFLKKDYVNAIQCITGTGYPSPDWVLSINSDSYSKLNEAGVLNLWFEPVYESEIKEFKMGTGYNTFTLQVKDRKVYHKNEDITIFVTTLVEHYRNSYIGGYAVILDNVTFRKTGCENTVTSLKQWIEIYEAIKL